MSSAQQIKNNAWLPVHVLFACFSGSVLEWYDFAIYGFLAPIISPLFFPAKNHWLSIIAAYAVFALGYLVRVAGGFYFGRKGDTKGRKSTMIATVLLMSIPTFLIGLLPTYHSIGVAAPLLLILLRVIQGFAAGGELIGVTTYIYELAPATKRALYCSFAFVSSAVGIFLGSLVVSITQHYFADHALAWRLPFLLSIVSVAVGPWLRSYLRESPQFLRLQQQVSLKRISLSKLFAEYKLQLVKVMLYFVPTGVAFYAAFVFMPGILLHLTHFTHAVIFRVNAINTLLILIVQVASGYVADRIGLSLMLRLSLLSIVILVMPCFYLFNTTHLYVLICAQAVLAISIGLVSGALMAYALSLSATDTRYTITATGYNLAYSIFGGTAPLLGAALVHRFNSIMPLGMYILALSLLLLFCHVIWRRKINN